MSYRPLIMNLQKQALPARKAGLHLTEPPLRLAEWRLKGLALLRCAFGCFWGVVAWQTALHASQVQFAPLALQHLSGWSAFWLEFMSRQPLLSSYFLAVCELCLALSLCLGLFTNKMYVVGSLLALFLWSTQGLSGSASIWTTGSMLLFLMLFLGLFLSKAGFYYGFDGYFASGGRDWVVSSQGIDRNESACERRDVGVFPKADLRATGTGLRAASMRSTDAAQMVKRQRPM